MSLDTINQPVNPGDLILAYNPRKAKMRLVTSGQPDNTDPSTIWVRRAPYSITQEAGCWTLSGPDVFYTEKDEDEEDPDSQASDDDDSTVGQRHTSQNEGTTLQTVLDQLASSSGGADDITVVVNPHGRQVLLLLGRITFATNARPGDFPEFWGSCCDWLSCPVCMGYDFVEDEKQGLRWLEGEEARLKRYQREAKESGLSKSDRRHLRALKHEIIEYLTEKYETINERKTEMGLPLDDVDKLVKDYTDCTFE